MITPEMFQQTPGVWYVDTRLVNYTLKTGVSLTITTFMSKCLYWNTTLEKWRSEGCMVGQMKHSACIKSSESPGDIICLRWERKALQSLHNVCVTTSLSLGAPSL